MRKATLAAAALAVASVAAHSSGDDDAMATQIEAAKEAVRAELKDPWSAKFQNVRYIPATEAICGEVNAKNSYGGYSGFKGFVHIGKGMVILEGDSMIYRGMHDDMCK